MFVVEIGNGPAARSEHLDGLLEELITGIQRLALLIARIVALLADIDHAVHGELARSARQSIGHAGIDFDAGMPFCALLSQIARPALFDKHRHNFERRVVKHPAKTVFVENAVDDVLRMQTELIGIR